MGPTLLHTAEAHRATFEALRDRIAPEMALHHVVRPDWLRRAQDGIDAALTAEITEAVRSAQGPVISTCTTIGEVAEAAGAMRIDEPMMRAAAQTGGPILMVHALDSTAAPSLALLERAIAASGRAQDVRSLSLSAFWPLFEAGETGAFHAALAGGIRDALQDLPDTGCVVLAQASMAGAAPLLQDTPLPVLSSPELAFRTALKKVN